MYEQLFSLIAQSIAFPESEEALCRRYFEPVLLPKNRVMEEEGKVPRYLYFIVSGFVRIFHYNAKGDEVTTHINCPPGFITSYSNYINQTVSNENVECVTDCELLRITQADLERLIQESPAFKDFSILVFQQSLSYNENRSKELATLSAEQRYKKLMDEHPEILHNVPVQYIASFLGMNPKSLSRIRKQMIR